MHPYNKSLFLEEGRECSRERFPLLQGSLHVRLNVYDVGHDSNLQILNAIFANSWSPMKIGGAFHLGVEIGNKARPLKAFKALEVPKGPLRVLALTRCTQTSCGVRACRQLFYRFRRPRHIHVMFCPSVRMPFHTFGLICI